MTAEGQQKVVLPGMAFIAGDEYLSDTLQAALTDLLLATFDLADDAKWMMIQGSKQIDAALTPNCCGLRDRIANVRTALENRNIVRKVGLTGVRTRPHPHGKRKVREEPECPVDTIHTVIDDPASPSMKTSPVAVQQGCPNYFAPASPPCMSTIDMDNLEVEMQRAADMVPIDEFDGLHADALPPWPTNAAATRKKDQIEYLVQTIESQVLITLEVQRAHSQVLCSRGDWCALAIVVASMQSDVTGALSS